MLPITRGNFGSTKHSRRGRAKPCVFVRIEESHAIIFARLNAMIDGFGGTFVEAHQLDRRQARGENPKRMTGHALTLDEAAPLLDRIP